MNNEKIESLEVLSEMLLMAKASEEKKRNERIYIEEKIAALIPGPARGSKTVTLNNGIKITVERGFNYKAELSEIEDLYLESYPPPIKIKTTRELDVNSYEWFRTEHPNLFNELSKYVTVTPKKTAVSIKNQKTS